MMNTIAHRFLFTAALAGLAAMIWQLQIAVTGETRFEPAQSFLLLAGWFSLAIFGFYYRAVPDAASGVAPHVHYALSVTAITLLVAGLVLVDSGRGHGVLILGIAGCLAAMLFFIGTLWAHRP